MIMIKSSLFFLLNYFLFQFFKGEQMKLTNVQPPKGECNGGHAIVACFVFNTLPMGETIFFYPSFSKKTAASISGR